MKLFGFRINAREIKDVREIEKTLENIEEKKNKIIDLAGQLSTLTEIKFKYSADGSIEKKFEVDGFEMDKILGNMRVAQISCMWKRIMMASMELRGRRDCLRESSLLKMFRE